MCPNSSLRFRQESSYFSRGCVNLSTLPGTPCLCDFPCLPKSETPKPQTQPKTPGVPKSCPSEQEEEGQDHHARYVGKATGEPPRLRRDSPRGRTMEEDGPVQNGARRH